MRSRFYNAGMMKSGIDAVSGMRQKMVESGKIQVQLPGMTPPAAAAEQPEMLEGHCLTCKTKRPFAVEGEDKMPNGAIRKYGTSGHPDCGHKVSHFVSGKAAA